MSDRDRAHEDSTSSNVDESSGTIVGDTASSVENSGTQHNIDLLFGTPQETMIWEPVKPPAALGELLDSRYMLPLLFPSDPRMLAAVSGDRSVSDKEQDKRRSAPLSLNTDSNIGNRVQWRSRNKKVRQVGVGALQWVDGIRSAARWAGSFELPDEDQEDPPSYTSDDPNNARSGIPQSTPLTRKPSLRSKGRGGTAALIT